jgi:hypothetical protein
MKWIMNYESTYGLYIKWGIPPVLMYLFFTLMDIEKNDKIAKGYYYRSYCAIYRFLFFLCTGIVLYLTF